MSFLEDGKTVRVRRMGGGLDLVRLDLISVPAVAAILARMRGARAMIQSGQGLFAFCNGAETCLSPFPDPVGGLKASHGAVYVPRSTADSEPEAWAAWFPERLDPISPRPTEYYLSSSIGDPYVPANTWAGAQGRHVHIITFESGEVL